MHAFVKFVHKKGALPRSFFKSGLFYFARTATVYGLISPLAIRESSEA